MWLYNIFLQAFLSSFKLLCIDDSQESQHYFNKKRFRLIRYDSVYIYIWNGLICNDRMVIVKESKQVYSTWKKERKQTHTKEKVEGWSWKIFSFFFVFFFGHPQIFRFIINFVWHTHSLNMYVWCITICVCDPNGGSTHSLSNFVSLSILLKKKTLVIFLNIVAIYIYPNHHQQLTTNN